MVGPDRPLIIQSDLTILLEVNHPLYREGRDRLLSFAELEKSPEFIHTYRLTPISLWNAASAGLTAHRIITFLRDYSRYPVPQNVEYMISDNIGRYGRLKLRRNASEAGSLILESDDRLIIEEILHAKGMGKFLTARTGTCSVGVNAFYRGRLKKSLLKMGYPVEDLAGYESGDPLAFSLRKTMLCGQAFSLRHYQREAVDIFHAFGSERGGCGVIVLPCGAGKTVVGMGVMEQLQFHTLILVTNITAVHQWRNELLDKTTLSPDQIGEYTGERKEVRAVTLTTYQMVTYRRRKEEEFIHFDLFTRYKWGLIIYDEVHLLPAPVFVVTSELQARRRLGLTATLVREDGHEGDVFSLIGPKRYDIPWKDLERRGWIAHAECIEIRCGLPQGFRSDYAMLPPRRKYRLAAENPVKLDIVKQLVAKHSSDRILIIGMYIGQLKSVATALGAPLITGQVGNAEREDLYDRFKSGEIPILVVSKVANFAIDLPDASVAIQISGTFGSRQEEAQRLGRILRPKTDDRAAVFYTIVTKNTRDQEFSSHRQLFLTEQGYNYTIVSINGNGIDLSTL